MDNQQQGQQIDANEVINELLQQIAMLTRENATLKVAYKSLGQEFQNQLAAQKEIKPQ